MNETITKEGDKYFITTVNEATREELIKDLDKRKEMLASYEKEIELLESPPKLNKKEQEFKDMLEKIESIRANEAHEAQIIKQAGGKDNRLKELKQAVEILKMQLKNREKI